MAAANGGEQEFVSWLDPSHPLDKIGTDNQPVALSPNRRISLIK